jgi:uncharacterized protein (DUF169 family)
MSYLKGSSVKLRWCGACAHVRLRPTAFVLRRRYLAHSTSGLKQGKRPEGITGSTALFNLFQACCAIHQFALGHRAVLKRLVIQGRKFKMRKLQTDLSIFKRFNFERPPLGVKFLFFKPEGVDPIPPGKELSLCELLGEAQRSRVPFYFDRAFQETCVGKILLGMQEMEAFAESGQIGEKLQIFQEARANYAFYQHVPKFEKGIVNYVAFSPLESLTFEPDLLIITADHSQAEIVMRSMTYSTGELYCSQTTPVMGCAWLYIYPFQSGKVNFIVPEMVHGMKGRELFDPGSIVISIPYQWIPTIARNLEQMTWHLPSHRSKSQYLEEFGAILGELADKAQKP